MRYKSGFEHVLVEDEHYDTPFRLDHDIATPFIALYTSGRMLLLKGYAWNGTSGGVPDTKRNMRGSAGHDAVYQLGREGFLPQNSRKAADAFFRDLCIEDGTPKWLAKIYYRALRLGGGKHYVPGSGPEIKTAP